MKNVVLMIFMIALLAGCNSPLNKKYNKETLKMDLLEVEQEEGEFKTELIMGAMMRSILVGENLEKKTYKDLLNEGAEWKKQQLDSEREQIVKMEEASRKKAERISKLTTAVNVFCFDKGYTKYDYQEYITLNMVVQNKSNKDIRAIKGAVAFMNLFGDEIQTVNFVYDKPLGAGEEVEWEGQVSYNKFIEKDVALKNKDLKDLKIVWEPESIIFEDGTTL